MKHIGKVVAVLLPLFMSACLENEKGEDKASCIGCVGEQLNSPLTPIQEDTAIEESYEVADLPEIVEEEQEEQREELPANPYEEVIVPEEAPQQGSDCVLNYRYIPGNELNCCYPVPSGCVFIDDEGNVVWNS